MLLESFPEEEYHLPFFDDYCYVRKQCPRCKEYFWTQDPDQNLCGEATSYGCAEYTFIGNSPTRRSYSVEEMRELFLSFFERNGHTRIKPYPIVARWRDDLYFTKTRWSYVSLASVSLMSTMSVLPSAVT
jgi:alanyl-tRNA synthetase